MMDCLQGELSTAMLGSAGQGRAGQSSSISDLPSFVSWLTRQVEGEGEGALATSPETD